MTHMLQLNEELIRLSDQLIQDFAIFDLTFDFFYLFLFFYFKLLCVML